MWVTRNEVQRSRLAEPVVRPADDASISVGEMRG